MRNDYIIMKLDLWYERCKISQNIGGAESFGQVTENPGQGKGIRHERIIDQVGSVWIWTQITSKGE